MSLNLVPCALTETDDTSLLKKFNLTINSRSFLGTQSVNKIR